MNCLLSNGPDASLSHRKQARAHPHPPWHLSHHPGWFSLSLLYATNCLLMWCLHSQCVASLYFLHPRPWGRRGLDVWLWQAPGRCLSELKESPVTWLFRWGIRGPGRSNILSRIVQPDTAKPSACSLPLSTVGTFFFLTSNLWAGKVWEKCLNEFLKLVITTAY